MAAETTGGDLLAKVSTARAARRKIVVEIEGIAIDFFSPTLNQVAELAQIFGGLDPENFESTDPVENVNTTRNLIWVLAKQMPEWEKAFPTPESLGEFMTVETLAAIGPKIAEVCNTFLFSGGAAEGEEGETGEEPKPFRRGEADQADPGDPEGAAPDSGAGDEPDAGSTGADSAVRGGVPKGQRNSRSRTKATRGGDRNEATA